MQEVEEGRTLAHRPRPQPHAGSFQTVLTFLHTQHAVGAGTGPSGSWPVLAFWFPDSVVSIIGLPGSPAPLAATLQEALGFGYHTLGPQLQ